MSFKPAFNKCFYTVKILSVRFLLTHPVYIYIYSNLIPPRASPYQLMSKVKRARTCAHLPQPRLLVIGL